MSRKPRTVTLTAKQLREAEEALAFAIRMCSVLSMEHGNDADSARPFDQAQTRLGKLADILGVQPFAAVAPGTTRGSDE